ncbi:MAG: branched-chain amino acid ABC transporter permease [Chloroflexota bacterium]|nr:branched-chain amino acid ABC transporter permease [Chloroflexota bacterium]
MRRVVIGVLALVAAVIVVLLPRGLSADKRDIVIFIGLYTIVGAGLTLLMGFAGQVSLGQGGFFAVGAYTVGILTVKTHWNPWIALLVAPVVAMAVGYVVGLPLLRLRGHHLAVATLAFGIIVYTLLNNLRGLTGGPIGLRGITQPTLGGKVLSGDGFYYFIWVIAALALIVAYNIVRSRPGRALRAIAQHEGAAESVGINVRLYRLTIFAIAATFAGAAGGLFASYFKFLSPDSFTPTLSILFLIIVAVGGLGNVYGALVGSASIVLLTEFLKQLSTRPGVPARAPVVLQSLVYATILVLIMLFMSRGLLPGIQQFVAHLIARFKGNTVADTRQNEAPVGDLADG